LLHNELEDVSFVDHEIQSLMVQEKQTSPEASTVSPEQVKINDSGVDTWQFAFGFGLGPTSISGKIANYLSTQACLSFDFNVNYQRWYFSLLPQVVFARLKRHTNS